MCYGGFRGGVSFNAVPTAVQVIDIVLSKRLSCSIPAFLYFHVSKEAAEVVYVRYNIS